MSPELTYFLKVNVALILFYAFYRLFFYKDTFFKLRRSILLVFFGLALVYPVFNLQEWIKEQPPMVEIILLYAEVMPNIVVEPVQQASSLSLEGLIRLIVFSIYFIVVGLLFIRFFIQLGNILCLALKSKRAVICNTKVYVLDKPSGPFSFFRMIFIYPHSHSEKETEEILIHECSHLSQWHSIDVIVSEIICIFCWMNPFSWLLKREVRHNLEYLADQTVLKSGFDSKSYQYHLLGLSHHSHNQAAANLYNSFNVLHLKNRISMMNKKPSRSIGKMKYLIFIPLVAVLILLSNIDAVTRLMNPKSVENKPERTVLTEVDEMPEFPGGERELLKFISHNIKYPADALEQGINGRVICSFTINEDGTVSDAEVIRPLFPSLDAEAIRVINTMPRWTPAKDKGKIVAFQFKVPITYRIQNNDGLSLEGTWAKMEEGSDPANPVYKNPDVNPGYPGGESELLKFIGRSIKYPKNAQENGKQGKAFCSFIIEKDGSISDVNIAKSTDDSELDNEALRVIKLLSKWTPGKVKGEDVRVRYVIPITFRLQ